ncbi:hypothetical protein HK104_005105 [Borealophlyctis nickersoniae]|nr:hypothetical protein HK104_005105 [Borealophlyctis nickersoniae]
MSESTYLSRSFAEQGLNIRVRKEVRPRKKHTREESGDPECKPVVRKRHAKSRRSSDARSGSEDSETETDLSRRGSGGLATDATRYRPSIAYDRYARPPDSWHYPMPGSHMGYGAQYFTYPPLGHFNGGTSYQSPAQDTYNAYPGYPGNYGHNYHWGAREAGQHPSFRPNDEPSQPSLTEEYPSSAAYMRPPPPHQTSFRPYELPSNFRVPQQQTSGADRDTAGGSRLLLDFRQQHVIPGDAYPREGGGPPMGPPSSGSGHRESGIGSEEGTGNAPRSRLKPERQQDK